jgi:transcriptional regulator with XRE-family HTH domain
MDLYLQIGSKIRDLRTHHSGTGISQESLAVELGVTPNTVSRWEPATYKPSVEDLGKLARFFKVSIADFFPNLTANDRLQALLSATGDLDDDDIHDLTEYARFRQARKALKQVKRRK